MAILVLSPSLYYRLEQVFSNWLLSQLEWPILVFLAALAPGLFKLVFLEVDIEHQQLLLLQHHDHLLLFDDGADLLQDGLYVLVPHDDLVLEEVADSLGLLSLARLLPSTPAPGLNVVFGLLLVCDTHIFIAL